MTLEQLEPKEVFHYFKEICKIPHGSGNVKQISDYCVDFAKQHGLKYRQDESLNVIIWKDGTSGYENSPAVILQGHIDMVAVKEEDCVKDMDKIAGIEEVIQDIGSMKRMQEKRVLKYLDLLSNQFLYQKMGFLLSEHKEKMGLSDEFFDICKSQIGKSKRYLTKDMSGGRYVDEWKLVIPENIYNMKNGVIEDATI
mgnify:CR=1 FL=1